MSTPDPSTTDWVPLWDLNGGGGTPDPHAPTHEPGGSDPLAVDAAGSVGSLRTLGTGAQQAAAGNDARLSNARTPTAHAASHQPGGADALAVDAAAATGSLRTLGTGAQQAAPGNDRRFAGYGTTLPASPADGQEYILVDSLTNPTYQWRLRYNAGSSSSYKWEFVGGTPSATSALSAVLATADSVWQHPAGSPTLPLPRAGEYFATFGGLANLTNPGLTVQVSCGIGVSAVDPFCALAGPTVQASIQSNAKVTAASAGATLNWLMYVVVGFSSVAVSRMILSVVPLRVA